MERFLVSASTGAMGSLLKKLGTMLSDEYKLLKGVRDDIKFLKDELEAMQAFLILMADVEEPDDQAKLRANAIRELSYDIEDKIDKFMVLVDHESGSNSEGFKEIFEKSMKKITNIKARHKIAKNVKDIKRKIMEHSERYARYKIDESCRPRNEKVDPRLHAIYKDASELVGINGPRDELLKWLSDKEGKWAHQPKVVSIVGYGGLGKTTLARQVYEKLRANYECWAFVSISRSPNMGKILSSLLCQVCKQDYAHDGAGDLQLIIDLIRDFLKDKRYFIIIDDIWDVPTWRILECTFSKNGRGSVVMTTTRKYDVAESCHFSDRDLVYKMQPLGSSDSKKLFFKRLFGCEEMCPSNLNEASEDILRKSGGLPLAINAISSLLATKKTKEEWDHIRHSIGFAQSKNSDIDAMAYILSLSYYDLPLYLRSCLLYITMFTEDYAISKRRLAYKWISEGFIHGEDGQDLNELGELYFQELINRSLIQPVGIGDDGKALGCRVHDIVLDFLIYKSTEENFSSMLSSHSKAGGRIRRLSLTLNDDDQESVEQLDLSHTRSLTVFGRVGNFRYSLEKLNALRVLDVKGCFAIKYHHMKDVGRLFQLRYLDISCTSITELPTQIGDLGYLETLDASGTGLVELPGSFTRLKRLVRLFVPSITKLPDGFGNMKNLQELSDINAFKQSLNFLEELGKLRNLRELSIVLTGEFDKESSKGEKLVSSLSKLDSGNLRVLYITLHLREKDATIIGHLFFAALNSIRKIFFHGGKLCWIAKSFLSLVGLEKLSMFSGEIDQQDIEMTGSIPNLAELSLLGSCVGPIIISGGFQQLRKLEMVFGFPQLMFEAGAMPNLKSLYIHIGLYKFNSVCGGFDFGIENLTNLDKVNFTINCARVRVADVETVECVLRIIVSRHPNHPTLHMARETLGMKDDE